MGTMSEKDLLKQMLLSREGDRRSGILMRQGKGLFHVSTVGHEAAGAIVHALKESDYLFPYYRDRTLVQCKGMSVEDLAREFFFREKSSSAGRNMPGHSSSREHNIFSVATPTGSQCLPAAGAAWGLQMEGKQEVVVCCIGDAATRQGEFFEAVCFAVERKLPIVFVVYDNKLGISTRTETMMPFRINIFDSQLFDHVDATNVEEVTKHSQAAVQKARDGEGPTILWCELDRLESHTSSDDHRIYRSPEEIEEMKDPIKIYSEQLASKGALSNEEFESLQKEVKVEVDEVYERVFDEPLPSKDSYMNQLFGDPVEHTNCPLDAPSEPTTMVDAINGIFRAALEKNPKHVFFGEDIEDPKGGVFGFTKGLSTDFPDNVSNSPLAECTILGTAVGLAATGWRPIFEVQFIDFMGPAFNQLMSQIATLRWRTNGDWSCPMVIYAPYGAYLPGGGMWHSESKEGIWAHIPGLRVAIPSSPLDVAGLFWSAFEDPDPSLILIPKHLMRKRQQVDAFEAIPFGKARILREGKDVTMVSWGNCLELAEEAANHMAEEDVEVEIIDLRTIVPCDWETIEKSLAKTGRLVVVHEDNRTCGFGATVVAEMVSVPERFDCLLSPPQFIARPDVHVPFCPDLEYAVLPDLDAVLKAIKVTLE